MALHTQKTNSKYDPKIPRNKDFSHVSHFGHVLFSLGSDGKGEASKD
jgi:hypothetical protein